MKKHRFSLILSGVSELNVDLANVIYEATSGDIELNMCNGVAFIECERPAPSLRQAIATAIAQVEGAGAGVRVLRVETEAANTVAKINADLLGAATTL